MLPRARHNAHTADIQPAVYLSRSLFGIHDGENVSAFLRMPYKFFLALTLFVLDVE